jgi:hypothetical protein
LWCHFGVKTSPENQGVFYLLKEVTFRRFLTFCGLRKCGNFEVLGEDPVPFLFVSRHFLLDLRFPRGHNNIDGYKIKIAISISRRLLFSRVMRQSLLVCEGCD